MNRALNGLVRHAPARAHFSFDKKALSVQNGRTMLRRNLSLIAAAALLLAVFSCSLTSIAARALSSGGGSGGGTLSVFMRENDPEIVEQALPTLIKTLEALLASEPADPNLNLTVGSAYIMYANAFIEGPSVRLDQELYQQKIEAKRRALNFYKRGASFVAVALQKSFPGAIDDPDKARQAVKRMKKSWVPYLYWYSAGTTAAFALDPMDIPLSMRVSSVRILMERALELEPGFMGSAISDFFISFHAGIPDVLGGDKSRVEEFYALSLKLNGGQSPGTYMAYAMATAVPAQDSKAFAVLMGKALAIDPDQHPDSRLMVILSQRNAEYYLSHIEDYFLE
jgi:predicted anti-sigma-YlaC factor YlaD